MYISLLLSAFLSAADAIAPQPPNGVVSGQQRGSVTGNQDLTFRICDAQRVGQSGRKR